MLVLPGDSELQTTRPKKKTVNGCKDDSTEAETVKSLRLTRFSPESQQLRHLKSLHRTAEDGNTSIGFFVNASNVCKMFEWKPGQSRKTLFLHRRNLTSSEKACSALYSDSGVQGGTQERRPLDAHS